MGISVEHMLLLPPLPLSQDGSKDALEVFYTRAPVSTLKNKQNKTQNKKKK